MTVNKRERKNIWCTLLYGYFKTLSQQILSRFTATLKYFFRRTKVLPATGINPRLYVLVLSTRPHNKWWIKYTRMPFFIIKSTKHQATYVLTTHWSIESDWAEFCRHERYHENIQLPPTTWLCRAVHSSSILKYCQLCQSHEPKRKKTKTHRYVPKQKDKPKYQFPRDTLTTSEPNSEWMGHVLSHRPRLN